MKRAIQIMFVFLVVGMFLVAPVAAQSNQGLSWGVSVSDRIDFNFVVDTDTDSINEPMYASITSTPVIPDSISGWGAVPTAVSDWKWAANDTSIGLYGLIFLTLIAVGSHMSVPVGNFTLMTTLVSAALTGEVMIDDVFYWGVQYTVDTSSTEHTTVAARYFKSDGFLAKLTVEEFENDVRTGYIAISRQGFMTTIADNFLIIIAGAVVLVVLVIVCVKRK
ncbi:MAG: hypothetical protein JW779_00045 [Candidatus Thorarchaeota archaeon]|nr:hypothetical protein [Candidatus Thorarchaeota archaeon]